MGELPARTRLDLPGNDPGTELIDFDQVQLPMVVRSPRPGDRFQPLGMHGASRPLADFFRGCQIPRDRRVQIPLVCDQDGIIWVVGHRIADRVKRTEQTRRHPWLAGDPGIAVNPSFFAIGGFDRFLGLMEKAEYLLVVGPFPGLEQATQPVESGRGFVGPAEPGIRHGGDGQIERGRLGCRTGGGTGEGLEGFDRLGGFTGAVRAPGPGLGGIR